MLCFSIKHKHGQVDHDANVDDADDGNYDDDDDDDEQKGGRGREEGRSPMFLSNVFPAIKYGLSSSSSSTSS